MSYFYVAELSIQDNGEKSISIQEEITQAEFKQITDLFWITGTCHVIDEVKDIVIENGLDFKKWMSPNNLQYHRSHGKSPEKLLLTSNKLVLNYAASIKTFIDIATRLIKQKKPDQEKQFHSLTSTFYDSHMEYRFWANFRNYCVHCALPYTTFHEAIGEPCEVVCTKEHLLKFDNWKHSKNDIERFPEKVDLIGMVDEMSSLICALYLEFYYIFAKEIVDATNNYAAYCKQYNIEKLIIMSTEIHDDIQHGRLVPLPIDKLCDAVKILQNHPSVNITLTN